MSKKVSFAAKPSSRAESGAADKWVTERTAPGAEDSARLQRLTIDIPVSLHRRIKVACAKRGTKISDEVRALLDRNYPVEQ